MMLRAACLFALALALAGCGSSKATKASHSDVCADQNFSGQGDVRVFVVGHRFQMKDATSYESYAASFRRDLDPVQHCLSAGRPTLVAFPENSGLPALLIGTRSAKAREQTKVAQAFVYILSAYTQASSYYKKVYPTTSVQRQVLLALGDVVWRATLQTFGGIARDNKVWVLTSVVVPREKHTDDPTLVQQLGDPDLDGKDGAYVAEGPELYNTALLFNPKGEVAGRVDKVFLTDPEETLLDLDNGSLSGLDVIDTPFARIGVATSRDAFYAPFVQRLDDLGVNLLIQPEAFSGWAIQEQPGDWLPDVFLSSSWLDQQKYAGIAATLTPQFTGNFFDMVFDGQVAITQPAAHADPGHAYIGQDPLPGFRKVGPWVVPDPGDKDSSLSLDQRRAALRQVGQALEPGSGDPREDQYVSSVVAANLSIAPSPIDVTPDGSLPASTAVAKSAEPERDPDLVADSGGRVLVAWQQGVPGSERIRFAISGDGGKSFGAAQDVASGSAPQRRPALCVASDDRIAAVWQDGAAGKEHVRAAILGAGGQSFGSPLDVSAGKPEWEPDCAFDASGALRVVWDDVSSGVSRLRFASLPSGASAFAQSAEVDPSSAGRDRLLGSQLQPALSSDAEHLVWLDYREKSWDVRYARWNGSAFDASLRLDGGPVKGEAERLDGEPRIEAEGDYVIAAWTDLRDRRAHADISYVASSDGGKSWSRRAAVPGGPETTPSVTRGGSSMPRYRPAIALGPGSARLVFQELAAGHPALSVSDIDSSGKAATPRRADDTGTSPVALTRPRAIQVGSATLVVHEDNRDGPTRIDIARVP